MIDTKQEPWMWNGDFEGYWTVFDHEDDNIRDSKLQFVY